VIGSVCRVLAAEVGPHPASGWPVTTLAVNLLGAFFLGAYLSRRQRAVIGPWSLQLWAIGALGSFTTFSAFSFEVVELLDAGGTAVAAGYVTASMIGGLAAALAGDIAGRRR
jgi:CrcB protein